MNNLQKLIQQLMDITGLNTTHLALELEMTRQNLHYFYVGKQTGDRMQLKTRRSFIRLARKHGLKADFLNI